MQFAAPVHIPQARAAPLTVPQIRPQVKNGRAFGSQTQGVVGPVAAVQSVGVQQASACTGSTCGSSGNGGEIFEYGVLGTKLFYNP